MKKSHWIFSGLISLLLCAAYLDVAAQDKVICKASVVFHGQELSGRMMFKQVDQDTVRFAFFNELGMSFVEGSVAVRSHLEIVKIADFLDYKSFRRNFERAMNAFLWDQKEEKLKLPVIEDESVEITRIYQKGRKFVFGLQLSEY